LGISRERRRPNTTEVYGVGAVLLAGSEVYTLAT